MAPKKQQSTPARPNPTPQRRDEPKPAPMPLAQAIRQAGTDGITKQEFKTITQDSGKSSAAVLQKIDQINSNLKEKDKTGISLGGAASNMLIREASKQTPNAFLSAVMGPTLGTGRLGTELQRRATDFGTTGSMGSLIPRGMQVMPSGRTTLPGVGPQFGPPKVTVKNPIGGVGYIPGGSGGAGTTNTTQIPEQVIPEEEIPKEETPQPTMLGIGADLSNWAPGFRRKQSSRGRGSSKTRTLGGATKVAPTSNVLGY